MAIKFEWNDAGFAELRTSAGAKALIQKHAKKVADAANAIPPTTDEPHDGDYFAAHDASDAKRARARVTTTDVRSMRHEARTQALEKGLANG